jgi:hypothetical protein
MGGFGILHQLAVTHASGQTGSVIAVALASTEIGAECLKTPDPHATHA